MKLPTVLRGSVVSLAIALGSGSGWADPTPSLDHPHQGLEGRLIVGYQGWFGCPGDFEGNRDWQHWFIRSVKPENFTVDMLPSMANLPTSARCDTGLKRADGTTIRLFSSQNHEVIDTHFRWMKEHGIDGAAMQRFVLALADPQKTRRSDNVLRLAMAAAEKHGRTIYLTYDVSGADPRTVMDAIQKDWQRLNNDLHLSSSKAYLWDNGKPVLQVWGFGFKTRLGEPEAVKSLIQSLKTGDGSAGGIGVTLIGGVPSSWRTLQGDSKSDPAWASVYRSFDVISPWSVGRMTDDSSARSFVRNTVEPDLVEIQRLGLRYQPVIFPGFSWHNLMVNRGEPARAIVNQIPRQCGRFMWTQVAELLSSRSSGRVDMMYGAMFDEVDEATAMLPTAAQAEMLPLNSKMVTLDADGCALPDDWYLQLAGRAAAALRSITPPTRVVTDVIRP